MICPTCRAEAYDITTLESETERWLCPNGHEFSDSTDEEQAEMPEKGLLSRIRGWFR